MKDLIVENFKRQNEAKDKLIRNELKDIFKYEYPEIRRFYKEHKILHEWEWMLDDLVEYVRKKESEAQGEF